MAYYPVFLNISDKRCIVIGGGLVGLRKVNMLLEYGAKVDVISPEICSQIEEMAAKGEVKLARREYESVDLEGAWVVIAATNNSRTNERVAKEAHRRGILINVVDVPRISDFIVPSYLRRGDLTVAVSTNGKSPALARKIRTELEERFSDEYAQLVSLVDEVRSDLKARKIVIREDVWQRALDIPSLLELLRAGKFTQAKEELLANLVKG
ncbi:MAG: bifunctional precorrin-2 dehydrogenase/sirohydrochlorin ferrochelatase [Dehalococcoidia bacterium]|nr:bifunctional precorrin-2 dehydrogenase/sirohydrochlorin ferrochelatase [Dehalococcoidia bacterium]